MALYKHTRRSSVRTMSIVLLLLPSTLGYTRGYSRSAFYDPGFHSTDKYDLYSRWFDETRLAPKTKQVQQMIYNHQNPGDCSRAKYIATRGFNVGGLGAELTAVASHLAWAMTNDHVLVWDERMASKYLSAECQSYSCIFQPLSRCEPNVSVGHIRDIFNIFLIPPRVERILHRSNPRLSHAQALNWWKVQSVAYVMRINEQALESIVMLRKNQSNHNAIANIPIPMPEGAVNIHIRRGNKIHEMDYVGRCLDRDQNTHVGPDHRPAVVRVDRQVQESVCRSWLSSANTGGSAHVPRVRHSETRQENIWQAADHMGGPGLAVREMTLGFN